jgi:hypothetical protein
MLGFIPSESAKTETSFGERCVTERFAIEAKSPSAVRRTAGGDFVHRMAEEGKHQSPLPPTKRSVAPQVLVIPRRN